MTNNTRRTKPHKRAQRPSADRVLKYIAHLSESLYGDIAAFGPTTHGDITARLHQCAVDLKNIDADLREARDPFLRDQLALLPQTRRRRPLKLHLGAGRQRLAGWVNIDCFGAELSMNLKWRLPFADRSAKFVFCSHMLEHAPRHDALALLEEVRRVLVRGGVARIIVPDVGKLFNAYAKNDTAFFADRLKQVTPWVPKATPLLDQFLSYCGASQEPCTFGHRYGYDFESLKQLLKEAGFKKIVRSSFMASTHKALRVDGATKVAHTNHRGDHFSLFVEAF